MPHPDPKPKPKPHADLIERANAWIETIGDTDDGLLSTASELMCQLSTALSTATAPPTEEEVEIAADAIKGQMGVGEKEFHRKLARAALTAVFTRRATR